MSDSKSLPTGTMRNGGHRYRIGLLNPNANLSTTALMTGLAEPICPRGVIVEGHTMERGPTVIMDETALNASVEQVVAKGIDLAAAGVDGLIVSAFGDPGLLTLRDRVDVPVAGIAEGGMAEAAAGGRMFSIVTTTPRLEAAILSLVRRYGHSGNLASLRITRGDVPAIMSDPVRIRAALVSLARECEADGAEALLIGGGPLAPAAPAVAEAIALPVIDPVGAGTRQVLRMLGLKEAAEHRDAK
ncbi:aspartate/glutamate racemase family protein [Amaricoccus tamworthensis]|uniref:aspartate/glutamate racemase family protein n=1 Tax=Amaricoccus tamworthensis TaxID=57002 RepID=UPI003C7D8A6D